MVTGVPGGDTAGLLEDRGEELVVLAYEYGRTPPTVHEPLRSESPAAGAAPPEYP
jgi:hypothetical protein